MALTPELFDGAEEFEAQDVVITNEQPEPSLTWRIDYATGRIGGQIDGIEAVRQFIRKAIATARSRYLIYDGDYGSELDDIIGQTLSPELTDIEIPRLVTEAVAYDDRISEVLEVSVSRKGSDALVYVAVETVFGEEVTEEVTL